MRSFLYAPGNQPNKLTKLGTFGEDAAILDLEDSVPSDQKLKARTIVRNALPEIRSKCNATYVRVNPIGKKTAFSHDLGLDDAYDVLCPELSGIVLPKTETPCEISKLDHILSFGEGKFGIPHGTLEIIPIIETGTGLWKAYEIARASSRIRCLHLGAADLTRDLGIKWSFGEESLFYARSRLVMISNAAKIGAPIDSVWIWLDNHDGFLDSCTRAKDLGFHGKSCIHPNQIPLVNQVFSNISSEELAHAEMIIEMFEKSEAKGNAAIRVGNQFVDYPMVEQARQLIRSHYSGRREDL